MTPKKARLSSSEQNHIVSTPLDKRYTLGALVCFKNLMMRKNLKSDGAKQAVRRGLPRALAVTFLCLLSFFRKRKNGRELEGEAPQDCISEQKERMYGKKHQNPEKGVALRQCSGTTENPPTTTGDRQEAANGTNNPWWPQIQTTWFAARGPPLKNKSKRICYLPKYS
jgi:hypothetical protein